MSDSLSLSFSPDTLRERLCKEALEAGFDVIGITDAHIPSKNREALTRFLAEGYHGEMSWLKERSHWRTHPTAMWPQVRSIIMLGMNYGPDTNPLEALAHKEHGSISVYARGGDYHQLVKKRLKRVARWLVEETGGQVKIFVDTAPVMEKPLAQRAGLGWQGKHTNLVSRQRGSWLFLGAIFTSLNLEHDLPEQNHCGKCRKCLDVCPTKAFPAPYRLDARRCIAYLTIEHRGHIPAEFRKAIGNRIFGCDDCLAVCPWNKFARKATQARFAPRAGSDLPALEKLLKLDATQFEMLYAGSPVKRAGYACFMRNVLIGTGNSGASHLVSLVEPCLKASHPVIRVAAVWALRQLVSGSDFRQQKERHLEDESDPHVLAEWHSKTD